MAPGVGKTFAMLEEAHRRKERGTDVVVGLVEAHGRLRTVELLAGLEVVPRRHLTYRGVELDELDTDAVIARHPAVVLVDELAHTNAPGSVHEKRWQDVETIRDAGIDVISTLNVQHLESAADAVQTITGAPVHERLPDAVLDGADEIELVDMSPRALRQRMKHGNIYPPDRAQIALDRFFTEPNLTALRELVLRRVARQVDTELQAIEPTAEGQEPWPVAERVMVLVGPHSGSRQAVRHAAALAASLHAPLMAVFIETPSFANASRDAQQDVREDLEFAEDLGATVLRKPAPDILSGVLEVARARQINHLFISHHPPPRIARVFRPSLTDALLSELPGLDLHLIRSEGD
jgi:two-component system sensor histidine kinase KdpD